MKNQLTYVNNWENDEYYVDGKRVKTLEKVMIKGELYKVTPKQVTVPYNDMGHVYTSTSTHYFITETVFGLKKEFDLHSIVGKTKVYADKFTVEEK